MEKLYRSPDNQILAGVIGGITEYINKKEDLEIDPTVLRIVTIVLFVLTGFLPVMIGYVLAMLVMPKKPKS